MGDKIIEDLGHEMFETGIESVVARVQSSVALDQPRRVRCPERSDQKIGHALYQRIVRLILNPLRVSRNAQSPEAMMGINTERDIEANLQIGPTDQGMVRLFIEAPGLEIPMDFDPEEAEEIAEEIRAAAQAARAVKG